jgi:hypothetical protein
MALLATIENQAVLDGFPAPQYKKPVVKAKPKRTGKLNKVAEKLNQAFQNYLEKQLNLPFLVHVDGEGEDREPILPVVPEYILAANNEDIATHHAARREGEVDFKWNDEHLFAAHAELLYKSLEVFTHPNNVKDKADVLCWMFAGDWLEVDGKRTWAASVAFSYNACCAICGYDPTVLQDFVFNALPKEVQESLHEELAA